MWDHNLAKCALRDFCLTRFHGDHYLANVLANVTKVPRYGLLLIFVFMATTDLYGVFGFPFSSLTQRILCDVFSCFHGANKGHFKPYPSRASL
jgi:hypothetical protein